MKFKSLYFPISPATFTVARGNNAHMEQTGWKRVTMFSKRYRCHSATVLDFLFFSFDVCLCENMTCRSSGDRTRIIFCSFKKTSTWHTLDIKAQSLIQTLKASRKTFKRKCWTYHSQIDWQALCQQYLVFQANRTFLNSQNNCSLYETNMKQHKPIKYLSQVWYPRIWPTELHKLEAIETMLQVSSKMIQLSNVYLHASNLW